MTMPLIQIQPRQRSIGRATLHEGKRGRWARVSWPVSNGDLVAVLKNEMSTKQYAKQLKQDARDKRRAMRLMGAPARGLFGRLWLRAFG